jgi:hypothetical protein
MLIYLQYELNLVSFHTVLAVSDCELEDLEWPNGPFDLPKLLISSLV